MDIAKIVSNIVMIEKGFQHILDAANQIVTFYTEEECFDIALDLFNNQSYQLRMLSTSLLGYVAVKNENALSFLRDKVSCDDNWRVQEMLAKSFDCICKERGYEISLPLISEWLEDNRPNVVRAVTEGLRIWTSRPYFKEHPSVAIAFLSKHKSNPSEYVRKSVGNALRDISKKFPQLVFDELTTWNQDDLHIRFTYQLAIKHIHKKPFVDSKMK